MDHISLDKTDSTNNWLANNENELPTTVLVSCREQTSGRGQRGNSWESEKDSNITASILFHPVAFPAFAQFLISETVALSIVEFLDEMGIKAKVKWPNDIYVGDKKICGILVEHVVTGRNISRTIAGFGININQKEFRSPAPNPISVSTITGKNYDIKDLLSRLKKIFEKNLCLFEKEDLWWSSREKIHNAFMKNLWRGDSNFYPFFDKIQGKNIEARIKSVGHDGILTIETTDGDEINYAFKEVEFII